MEVSWKGFLALLEVFPCTVLEEMVYLLFFFLVFLALEFCLLNHCMHFASSLRPEPWTEHEALGSGAGALKCFPYTAPASGFFLEENIVSLLFNPVWDRVFY